MGTNRDPMQMLPNHVEKAAERDWLPEIGALSKYTTATLLAVEAHTTFLTVSKVQARVAKNAKIMSGANGTLNAVTTPKLQNNTHNDARSVTQKEEK